MTDKIYSPDTIEDQPLPGEVVGTDTSSSQSTSGGVTSQGTTKNNSFPIKKTAVELLSTALNTKSKKILQEFEFTESGALQIGKYINGVSGDLRISPNGITARDLAGLTTFTIDGTTGSAVFAGEVRSGSTVTGDMIIEPGGTITLSDSEDTTIIDGKGLVSTASFPTDQAGDISGTVSTTNSTTLVDMPDCTLSSFDINRTTTILTLLSIVGKISTGDVGRVFIYVGGDVADVQQVQISITDDLYSTYMTYNLRQITAGTPPTSYILKAKWTASAGTLSVSRRQITRMTLGA